MIKHENWDQGADLDVSGSVAPYKVQEFTLPSVITEIRVSHDGGRLTIEINGQQVFYDCEATRDCTVTLDSAPLTDNGSVTMKPADLATQATLAHVICRNDSVEFVVLDNDERAQEKLETLKAAYYERNKLNFRTPQAYKNSCYWHIHTVDAEASTGTITQPQSDGVKSVSDDDLCATCTSCSYRPGEMSSCNAGWPGQQDADGYIQVCFAFSSNAGAAT